MKFILFILLFIPGLLRGVSYYSMSDGVFETNIWSNSNSPIANCGCNPGCSISSNSIIYIKHNLTSNCANLNLGSNVTFIIMPGGSFTLSGNGSITGTGSLIIQPGGIMVIGGNISLNGAGSTTVDGTLNVYGDFIDLNGGSSVCGSGNINVVGTVSIENCTSGTNPILPISLIAFQGERVSNYNFISWSTVSELNSDRFEIQEGRDGILFETVGVVKSKSQDGFSNSILYYSFDHFVSGDSAYYYRLKPIDFNGDYEYSGIIYLFVEAPILVKRINIFGIEVDGGYEGIIIEIYNNGYYIKRVGLN